MTNQHQGIDTNETATRKQGVSPTIVFFIAAAMTILGFATGVYRNHIYAAIAPVFGISAYAGELDLSSVQQTYQALKANFDGELDDATLIDGANRGLVEAAGDEYTVFMNAAERAEFDDDLSGSIGGGIGAEIGVRNDRVTVIRTLADTPAAAAGVQANDIIVAINDESTEGWTTTEAVTKIRGEVGTTVKLRLLRGLEQLELTITRAEITSPSVEYKVEDGIGTLTISRFDQETTRLARAAAQEFVTQNVTGVVVDLRNNGGGYLTAARDVSGLWLDTKVVVAERANDVLVDELKTGSNALLLGVPTVVLVNGSSASASEIVAGALQDHGAATIVGEQTFGKGTVQKLISLTNGAQLKVTVARWYTPNGKNISEEGITPDVEAALTQDDVNNNRDPQRDAALEVLRQ